MEQEDQVMIDPEVLQVNQPKKGVNKPKFKALKVTKKKTQDGSELRRVIIPENRLGLLKREWLKIYTPLVDHLRLQVRMNVKAQAVEIRTCQATTDAGALQKGVDFLRAFALGFHVDDALALLRLDDLYIDTFEIKDGKSFFYILYK
jgi:RNA-binding protein PNO1